MDLALPEWTVLALLREESRHGFALAGLTARQGELGRVWHVPKPMIYRALDRLTKAELIAPSGVESDRGPSRTVFALTDSGRDAVEEWLHRPVEHVREMRSTLLMKLALLDRRDLDRAPLLRRQREVLEPIVSALDQERADGDGFTEVLMTWRYTSADAALRFVAELESQAE